MPYWIGLWRSSFFDINHYETLNFKSRSPSGLSQRMPTSLSRPNILVNTSSWWTSHHRNSGYFLGCPQKIEILLKDGSYKDLETPQASKSDPKREMAGINASSLTFPDRIMETNIDYKEFLKTIDTLLWLIIWETSFDSLSEKLKYVFCREIEFTWKS